MVEGRKKRFTSFLSDFSLCPMTCVFLYLSWLFWLFYFCLVFLSFSCLFLGAFWAFVFSLKVLDFPMVFS